MIREVYATLLAKKHLNGINKLFSHLISLSLEINNIIIGGIPRFFGVKKVVISQKAEM